MRIVGDLIPFLGWRIIRRPEFIERGLHQLDVEDSPVGVWEVFEFEWFNHGWTLAIRPVWEERA